MEITPISSVSNNYKNLSFESKQENTKPENELKMSTTSKVVVGSALAVLATTGIYIATRGKIKKSLSPHQSKSLTPAMLDMKVVKRGLADDVYTRTLDEVIKFFKSMNPSGYVKIRTTKDGKTYVKLLNNNTKENPLGYCQHMYVFDKNGKFDHRIRTGIALDAPVRYSAIYGADGALLRTCEVSGDYRYLKKLFPDGKYYERDFVDGENYAWELVKE